MAHGVVVPVVGDDDEDRTEDLFSCHGGIVADPDDQRRIDEEPPGLLGGPAPTDHDRPRPRRAPCRCSSPPGRVGGR